LLTAQVILIFPFLVGVIVLLFAIPGGEYIAEAVLLEFGARLSMPLSLSITLTKLCNPIG
jgi:hypothetical protein